MKQLSYVMLGAAVLLCWTGQFLSVSAQSPSTSTVLTDDTKWGPAPPLIPPGAQFAVLEGDPTAADGDYTIRLKMPDGYRIPPHWHPLRENVTVISGIFKVGMGDTFALNNMKTLTAGRFAYLDPDMHHYAIAVGEVIVQVHGKSPLQFNYVNPQDDPSRTK
jgi:hypothetical protein